MYTICQVARKVPCKKKRKKLRERVETEDGCGVLRYLDVCGEGTAVENPPKSLALSPISLRGAILLLDENSLLDCMKNEGRISRVSM